MKIRNILVVGMILAAGRCLGVEVLQGDVDQPSAISFSFPISAHVTNRSGRYLYVGALNNVATDTNFSFSAINRDFSKFFPLAPKTVTINGVSEQPNPMFKKGVKYLTLIDSGANGAEHPIVVLNDELSNVYGLDSFYNLEKISLLRAESIPDANGLATSGIVQIEAISTSAVFATGGAIFAAVKPEAAGSMFGAKGSGIALLLFGIRGNDESKRAFGVVDAPTGKQGESEPKALPLDVSSEILKIGSNLISINDAVVLHVNPFNGLLYIGLQVTAGAVEGDGARAIAVARLDKDKKLILQSIVSPNALDGNDKIIGTKVAGSQVSIQEIGSMLTSTSLPYLIVRGGNGDMGTTQNMVFAFPLVSGNNGDDIVLNGSIADKTVSPEDTFFGDASKFIGRHIKKGATKIDEMTTNVDAAAQVGGGVMLPGDIVKMFVQGDTVFVGTFSADTGTGIFYSQAIFEANGKIKSWTQWRRYAGVAENVFDLFLDGQTSQINYLTGDSASTVNTVKRTKWSVGDESGTLLFNSAIGPVCGLFDFSVATPALDNISLVASVGGDCIVLGQTGQKIGDVIIPTQGPGFSYQEKFEDGTISIDLGSSARVLNVCGGALEDVGSLTSVEIARSGDAGDRAWLFCGGCNGLAVLSGEDGSGIVDGQLASGFEGLTEGMAFKKIGNYKFVRKLVSDGDFLFVLTDTQLDRINLAGKGSVTQDNLDVTTIATSDLLLGNGSFLDVIVSGKFALLGTSDGLFRVGDNGNVATNSQISWARVPVSEGVGPVTQLFAVSKSGRAQDVSKDKDGGNIYVFSADRGNNRSRINRFAVASVSGSKSIDSNTLQPLNDLFVKDVPSYLASFGEFRDFFATDGALNLHARAQERGSATNLKVLPVNSRVGNSSKLVPNTLKDGSGLPFIVQNSSSGSWLVGNDLGVHVNE